MTYILEYSPTEGYHISTEADHQRNLAICLSRQVTKDYRVLGRFPSWEEAMSAKVEHMKKQTEKIETV